MSETERRWKILFIDDDLFFAKGLCVEITKYAIVEFQRKASEALKQLKGSADEYDCVVLDVMMPSPRGWEEKTSRGLFTGVEILSACRGAVLDANLPVILMSNNRDVIHKIKSVHDGLPYLKGLVMVREKRYLNDPLILAKEVRKLIKKWRS